MGSSESTLQSLGFLHPPLEMKDKNIAALLAFFLGGVGVHKFYLGQIGWGVVYLMFCWTFIPTFVAFIEFLMLALMDQDEFNRRFNGMYTLRGQPVVIGALPPASYPPPHGYGYGVYPPGYPGVAAGPYPHQAAPPPGYPHPPPGYPAQPGYPPPQARPAPPRPAPGQHGQQAQPDLAARLEKLNELRIAGLLTEEEFNQQKAKLLSSM